MKNSIKKFIIYFVIFGFLLPIIYFLIKKYDFDGNTTNRIISNKYYLIFLSLSIVTFLSLYGTKNNKTKFYISFIVLINCLYLFFLFFVGNIGLTQNQGLLILGFLILCFVSLYLKNRFGYTIFGISILGILVVIFLGTIPLFDEGPDISGFENNFNTKFIIYSNVDLSEDKAQLTKDNKIFKINEGLISYDFKNNQGTQIIFKSDNNYQNSFGFIVFKGGNFVEITPQSAINIDKNNKIEILTGNIKYYTQNQTYFSFTGEITPSIEYEKDTINIINSRYNENLKDYIQNTLPSFVENKTLLKTSQITLNILSKIFPNKYKDNLNNLEKYINILDIDLNSKEKLKNETNMNDMKNDFLKGIKKGFNMTK